MPWSGAAVCIFIAPEAGASMQPVEAVRAVPGRGLEGDRYFYGSGSFSRWPGPHREVTLIAEEDLEAMAQETGVRLAAAESRRNLLTRGVPLRSLIREEFAVGGVRLRGLRTCQPCKYLARLTGKDVLPALIDRGGIRARILSEGTIRIGDPARLVRESPVEGGA